MLERFIFGTPDWVWICLAIFVLGCVIDRRLTAIWEKLDALPSDLDYTRRKSMGLVEQKRPWQETKESP